MRITDSEIQISTPERRLMKRSVDLAPFTHEQILDVCQMAQDALDEEFADEFEFFNQQRHDAGSIEDAFHDVRYANFDTVRLARMVKSLTDIALGRPQAWEWELEVG